MTLVSLIITFKNFLAEDAHKIYNEITAFFFMIHVVEERRGFFRLTFISSGITIAISALLIILAMIFYPGGNFAGLDIEGYSLMYNGLCDMRSLTALNGEPNLVSSILLKIGIVVFSLATTFLFGALSFLFHRKRSTKYLSLVGSFFGIIQGPLFALIIFLHNVAFEVHMTIVILAPIFQYLAVILYAIIYFIDGRLPKVTKYSMLMLAITSVIFAILVGIANGIGGNFNYITQRLGTNLFNFLSVIIYIIQGVGLFVYLKKTNQIVIN